MRRRRRTRAEMRCSHCGRMLAYATPCRHCNADEDVMPAVAPEDYGGLMDENTGDREAREEGLWDNIERDAE
jgi:hypothetical protein